MSRNPGVIRIDYSGNIPEALREYLSAVGGVEETSARPLVLTSADPERLLGGISPFLRSAAMGVQRIRFRGAVSGARGACSAT